MVVLVIFDCQRTFGSFADLFFIFIDHQGALQAALVAERMLCLLFLSRILVCDQRSMFCSQRMTEHKIWIVCLCKQAPESKQSKEK
jgi:hypothetical protein